MHDALVTRFTYLLTTGKGSISLGVNVSGGSEHHSAIRNSKGKENTYIDLPKV